MDYIAYLHKDRKSDFGVSFPDFPGCITAGRTLEEARRRAAEALSFLLSILNHTSDMKAQGFCRSAPRFFQISTSRNAPRKIWEAHAKIRFTILMQICDVIHQSPHTNACLLFEASQRANRYISKSMWHSDPSWLHRMLELVAPNMRNLI